MFIYAVENEQLHFILCHQGRSLEHLDKLFLSFTDSISFGIAETGFGPRFTKWRSFPHCRALKTQTERPSNWAKQHFLCSPIFVPHEIIWWAAAHWDWGRVIVTVPALGCPEVSRWDLTRHRLSSLPYSPNTGCWIGHKYLEGSKIVYIGSDGKKCPFKH